MVSDVILDPFDELFLRGVLSLKMLDNGVPHMNGVVCYGDILLAIVTVDRPTTIELLLRNRIAIRPEWAVQLGLILE